MPPRRPTSCVTLGALLCVLVCFTRLSRPRTLAALQAQNGSKSTEDLLQFNGSSYAYVQIRQDNLNFTLTVYDTGDTVSNSIKERGAWDGALSSIMLFILNFRNEKNQYILDFGANIGWFSLLAAADGHKSFACEAYSSNLVALKRSIFVNGFEENIFVFPYALGSDRSPSELCIGLFVPGEEGYNVGNAMAREADDSCSERAQVKKLDNILKSSTSIEKFAVNNRFALMKADCEGCEARAILGASHMFSHYPPCSAFIEWRPDFMRRVGAAEDPESAATLLQNAGYSFFSIHADLESGHDMRISTISHSKIREVLEKNHDLLLLHPDCFSKQDMSEVLEGIRRIGTKINSTDRRKTSVVRVY